jgi:SPP1 gp7 family putative phage head morphogenesis protein
MAANEELFDAQLRHAIGIRRVAGGDVQQILAMLKKAERDLEKKLSARLKQGDFTSKRYKKLLKDIRDTRKALFAEIHRQQRDGLVSLAKAEQVFQTQMLNAIIPIQLDYAIVQLEQLRALVTATPFSSGAGAARTLSQWWTATAAADQARIIGAIQIGMTNGETVPQMVARVMKSQKLTRANAEAVVRTAVNHVSNASKEAFMQANEDIVQALRWNSTLDGRTSAVCRARDGHYRPVSGDSYEGVPKPWLKPAAAKPPAHPSCRSILISILDALGIEARMPPRPFVRDARTRRQREKDFRADAKERAGAAKWKSWSEQQRRTAIRRERIAWVKENVGTVRGDVTYDQWLRRQPTAFQNEVLGIAKGKAFRKGLKLDQFVDRQGNELTLVQLQAKYPSYVTAPQ